MRRLSTLGALATASCLAACLLGCASLGPGTGPAPGSCGLDAAERLSAIHAIPLGKAEKALEVHARARGGILGRDLKAGLEAAGFTVSVFAGSLDEICGLASRGTPAVVMLQAADGSSHYALASACDRKLGRLTLEDGPAGQAPSPVPFDEFLPSWERAGRFTLAAAPKASSGKPAESVPLPRTADDPALLLRSAGDTECVSRCRKKRDHYRTEECETTCKTTTPPAPSGTSPSAWEGGRMNPTVSAITLLLCLGVVLWAFL